LKVLNKRFNLSPEYKLSAEGCAWHTVSKLKNSLSLSKSFSLITPQVLAPFEVDHGPVVTLGTCPLTETPDTLTSFHTVLPLLSFSGIFCHTVSAKRMITSGLGLNVIVMVQKPVAKVLFAGPIWI
jgi:hypothetical protein